MMGELNLEVKICVGISERNIIFGQRLMIKSRYFEFTQNESRLDIYRNFL